MMSILLLTLLSRLHCHPPFAMSSSSLLPVAKVDESPVQNVVPAEVSEQLFLLVPDSKSRMKTAFLKLVFGSVALDVVVPPLTSKKSAQSAWVLAQSPVSGAGGQVFATLPSSCMPSE